jgi:WD40 repeat protein
LQNQSLLKSIDILFVSCDLPVLNDVQITVLEGTLAGESYPTLADRSTYTVEYIREVGARLWQLLAQALGEPVNKKNIRSILQRYQQSLAVVALERQYFWGESIDVSIFYGRTKELKTLNKWITKDRCRLIEILAMGGMGKTAVAVKLAQQVSTEFDFVVWRSLRNAPPLSDILAETIALLSRQQEIALAIDPKIHLARLIHYLQQHRCLLIFDNVESILQSGSRQYLAGYEGYGELFRQAAECAHQSCVLLTSREHVAEVANFSGHSLPVRTLPLGGLSIEAGMAILDDKGLPLSVENGQELVDLYAGNPLALKIISTSIVEVFDGQIADFFEQGTTVFNGIRMLLERQFERLSSIEQQVMYWLAIDREWVSVGDLKTDILPAVSTSQLLEALEYLQGRSLIEVKGGRFTQQPVVMEYAIEKLLMAVRSEICSQTPKLFLTYALMKAQSKDYVRDSQIRVIVQPLLGMLASDLGGEGSIVRVLKQTISQFAAGSFAAGSYGTGNCLNLLNQLQADLTGLDLTGLNIRQADLRDVSLAQVNLTQANLATSLFAESIGDIYKIAISPDDRLVANAGSDGKISIWHISTGKNILTIKAHDGHIVGLVFTADSSKLISSSFDRHIKIWDLTSGECIKSWQSLAPIYGISLSHDGQILASSCESGDILLWNVSTGELLKTLIGHTSGATNTAFQPSGILLASASFDSKIKLWNLVTGECINTLTEHIDSIWSIAFNSCGTQLVSGSFDTSIKIWNVQTGLCLQTIPANSRAISAVIFSPDDRKIISASQDSTIQIWEVIQLDNWQCTRVLQGHQNNIWSIALDSSGETLISSDLSGVLKIWDLESGQSLKTFCSVSTAFRSLAFHPTSNLLASSSEDGRIRLWDFSTDRCLRTILAHKMAVWQIAFSPEGDLLASCSMDGTVKLWHVSADSNLQEHLQPLQTDTSFVLAIAFHPHTKILASGSFGSAIRYWDYGNNQLSRELNQEQLGEIKIFDLAFHPTGQLIAVTSNESDITIWDIETSECYRTLKEQTSHNWSVAFHPQGDLLASGGEDYSIRLCNIHTGEYCHVFTGHTGAVSKVVFNLDGSHLVSASKDYSIRIWDVATGKCIKILAGHTDLVNCVVYHPDPQRRLLASCSHDETIRLWDTETWECLKVLRPQRVYEDMNITGATGLSPAQLATLKTLGAITRE